MNKFFLLEGPKCSGKTTIRDRLIQEFDFKRYYLNANKIISNRDNKVAEFMLGFQFSSACMYDVGINLLMDRGWFSICFYHQYPIFNKYYDWWMENCKKWDIFKVAIIEESEEELDRRRAAKIGLDHLTDYYSDQYKREEISFFSRIVESGAISDNNLIVGNSDYVYNRLREESSR